MKLVDKTFREQMLFTTVVQKATSGNPAANRLSLFAAVFFASLFGTSKKGQNSNKKAIDYLGKVLYDCFRLVYTESQLIYNILRP